MRVAANNDKADLERDQIDVALQFALPGSEKPDGEHLFRCETLPVCAPTLARRRAHPLRAPADLAHHVRLDFETLRGGRWFSEWDYWFDKSGTAVVHAASSLRFSQLEQVLPAAIEGDGVAMGALPHFVQVLRDGRLYAPFGRAAVAYRGDFYIVIRRDVTADDAVEAFVKWLRSEVRRDGEEALDRSPKRPGARTRRRGP